MVVRGAAVGADDPWSASILGRELLRHHGVPAAGEEAAAARVLPRQPVSVHVHFTAAARLARPGSV